ncbi:MAG: zinc dependent phospholipase C family protein [Firmicutes bacterium]|nr:zinc dependent phospholipase C family protein [Dethiobacter sp.]MBS3889797.1 zinc dependent phospholipase C family protein [Bacillota bacterium]
MLSGTHRMFGRAIGHALSKPFSGRVVQAEFESGCVRPDFDLAFFNVPHYKDKSLPFVMRLLSQLTHDPLPKDEPEWRRYSTQLGVTMHFMADYFCYAHNDRRLMSLPEHLVYEYSLHSQAARLDLPAIAAACTALPTMQPLTSVALVHEYIERMHARYLAESPAMDVDIHYALTVCSTVAAAVVLLSYSLSESAISA